MNEKTLRQIENDRYLMQRRPGDPVRRPNAQRMAVAATGGGLPEDSDFSAAVDRVLAAIETSGTVQPRYTPLTFEELGCDD
jgi:hypothetical protein